jgi:hypothetical protein
MVLVSFSQGSVILDEVPEIGNQQDKSRVSDVGNEIDENYRRLRR